MFVGRRMRIRKRKRGRSKRGKTLSNCIVGGCVCGVCSTYDDIDVVSLTYHDMFEFNDNWFD